MYTGKGNAVSQPQIGFLYEALTPLLDMFYDSGQNRNVIINPTPTLGWPVTLPFFPSAIFLCFPDSECWIKLVLPPLQYNL